MTSLLIVEDEANLAETLRFNLEREGYDVYSASDGQTGLDLALRIKPNLILLDLMLPVLSGTEVLKRIRAESDVPVLVITARTAETDRVQGLDLGADDYLTKPFGLAELLARVRAHLRRNTTPTPPQPSTMAFGAFTLDLDRRQLRRGEAVVALRPKEYELLAYLARRPGKTFTRDELLNDVWDINFAGGTRTVDVHVRWLRQKIEQDSAAPLHLITVRGAGYRFET